MTLILLKKWTEEKILDIMRIYLLIAFAEEGLFVI